MRPAPRWVFLAALAGCSGEAARADADAAVTVDAPVAETSETPDVPVVKDASPEDLPAAEDVPPPPADVPAAATGCQGLSGAAGDTTLRFTLDGRERVARVHVPPSYDPTREAPLVLTFHGWLMTGSDMAALSGVNAAADSRGYIAVTPDGVDRSWNAGVCCGTGSSSRVDDVAFVRAILDRAESLWCVDRRRVYAMGFSNGGAFSHRLGCEMSDRIAAIAPVAGTLAVTPCAPRRPVPVWHTHGTFDLVVPFNGGGVGGMASVGDTIANWLNRDGCVDASTEVYRRGSTVCESRRTCGARSEVTLCTRTGGGHEWPRGDYDATAQALEFFSRHAMP